ncbi:MAG: M1 family metallopeptidase [Bacteroidota bacterium]
MKFRLIHFCLLGSIVFVNCKPSKQATTTTEKIIESPYRASVKKTNNLIHTSLLLEPDFAKKELSGRAFVTLAPHFYPTDSLTLNAKYMRIESVSLSKTVLVQGENKQSLNQADYIKLDYTYDSLFLRIKLDRTYTKDEKYTVFIQYTAQPEKCKTEGGTSIKDDKGMYFINADGKDKFKPTQIWTQGETEAASCWFPTLDAPNQKTTQDLSVTIPDEYQTISNGLLKSSTKTGNNKRIDFWQQTKPHSPYLFALVVGKFNVTKDKWRDKEVNYYVDSAFAPYAKMVFGNTPEMIEFYSQKLGVNYQWDKYSQVVVHDFVSGAMENTGCVVHYDKLQHNSREHLDNTYEDIIAHELFHHWFGDLVTCESWSNLPLNESFATYGEYLWNEYKYGRAKADMKFDEYKLQYFNESYDKEVNLIRYHYDKKDDMFDRHSYQKGGAILHMLRKYMGDEAFFKSLNLYLTRNAFKNAEIHDLRIICEEVIGEDMHWFFDQWFMGSGHPTIEVKHQPYNGSGKAYAITILQTGDKLFKLPVDVDFISSKGVVERHRIVIEKDSQTFVFTNINKPEAVIFDAEYQLLAKVTETKSMQAWEMQLKKSRLYAHKIDALNELSSLQKDKAQKIIYYKSYLNDSFWHMREIVLQNMNHEDLTTEELKPYLNTIEELADKDPKSDVRAATIPFFSKQKNEDQLEKMLNDSSYLVASEALEALGSLNRKAAYSFANKNREEQNDLMQRRVFLAIGQYSDNDETDFFISQITDGNDQTFDNAKYGLFYFTTFNDRTKFDNALSSIETLTVNKETKDRGVTTLREMKSFLESQIMFLQIAKIYNKEYKGLFTKIEAELKEQIKKIDKVLLKFPEPVESKK